MAGRGTDIKLDDDARAVGGLKVIGTQRHESRRIDNQLKGRSGRQGDPGESVFYLSLDDDVLRLYGSDRMKNILTMTGMKSEDSIENRTVNKFVKKAQNVIEAVSYTHLNVGYMQYMFRNCSSLTELNLLQFNTESVEAMSGMFRGCTSLISLNIKSFNTSNVIYMSSAFQDCILHSGTLKQIHLISILTEQIKTALRLIQQDLQM